MTRGRLWKPLLAVVCVLCCAALAPALAAADEPGSIAGTVTEAGATPTPIEGARVCAEDASGEGASGCALTGALGNYSIGNLPPSEYIVIFTGQTCEEIEFEPGEFELGDCTAKWAEQLWQDVAPNTPDPPTPVTVEADQPTTGIDAELEAFGALSGTIEGPAGPIANSMVCVNGDEIFHGGCTLTDSNGEYTVSELPPAKYFIQFTGLVCDGASECVGLEEEECLQQKVCTRDYVAQYSFHHVNFDPEHLDPVTVESKKTTEDVDATLVAGGSIKGTLTVAALGDPAAEGATVCASSDEELRGECVPVGANGEWEIHGLATGSWYLQFNSPCAAHNPANEEECVSEPFLSEYWDGQAEEEDATHIQVTAPEMVSGIDTSIQLKDATTPAFTTNPAISGNPYVGETLTCGGGAWSNYPTAISYTWKRDINTLPGQTSATHVVTNADKNEALTCEVTIENGAGKDSATSSAVTMVTPPAPVFTTNPALSGTPAVGSTLTCSPGTWTGPRATASYEWQRDGTAIAGKTGNAYVVTSADEGASLTCAVTIEDEGGAASKSSNALAVPVTPPSFTSDPALSGTAAVGSTLTCSPGTWTGNQTSTTYVWQRGGATVAGQTGNTYVVTSADEGASLTCAVTIANEGGSATRTSNALPVPVKEPSSKSGTANASGNATVKGGKAKIPLKCTGSGSCKGSLKLVYEKKTKNSKGKTVVTKVTIGNASFSLAKGAEKTVAVKLTSKGIAYVEEAGKKGLKVKLTGSGVKGRTVTLKLAA